jgi:hypothetical protein
MMKFHTVVVEDVFKNNNNMENIKDSVKKVLEAKPYYKDVDKFARSEYYKWDKADRKTWEHPENHGWRGYNGFEVISENKIRIIYSYGGGDMEFEGHFEIDI